MPFILILQQLEFNIILHVTNHSFNQTGTLTQEVVSPLTLLIFIFFLQAKQKKLNWIATTVQIGINFISLALNHDIIL